MPKYHLGNTLYHFVPFPTSEAVPAVEPSPPGKPSEPLPDAAQSTIATAGGNRLAGTFAQLQAVGKPLNASFMVLSKEAVAPQDLPGKI